MSGRPSDGESRFRGSGLDPGDDLLDALLKQHNPALEIEGP